MKAFIAIVLLAFSAQARAFSFGPGSPDCPPDATVGQQAVPDPNDCTKYSKCSAFFSGKFSCKLGEHFSPTEKKCMSPWTAGCDPAYMTTTAGASEQGPASAAPATLAPPETSAPAAKETPMEAIAAFKALIAKQSAPAPAAEVSVPVE